MCRLMVRGHLQDALYIRIVRIIALIIAFAGILVYGQKMESYPGHFITTENGLPANDVYHIVQDKDLFIWIATDNGVVKYNGSEMTVFDSDNGLPYNSVLHLFYQGGERIYGSTFYNKFFYIEDDEVYVYPYNDELNEIIPDFSLIFSFYVDEMGNHHFGTRAGYVVMDQNGEIIESDLIDTYIPGQHKLVFWERDGYVFAYHKRNVVIDSIEIDRITDTGDTVSYRYKNSPSPIETGYGEKFQDYYAIIGLNCVVVLGEEELDTVLLTGKNPVNVTSIDSSMWVSTLLNGVYRYDLIDGKFVETDHYLDGFSVTTILKDHQNNYWFTTKENGVNQLYELGLTKEYEAGQNKNISSFYVDTSNIYIGFDNGSMVNVNDPQKSSESVRQIKVIRDFEEDGSLFLGGNSELYNIETGEVEQFSDFLNITRIHSFHDLVRIDENQILLMAMGRIFLYDYRINNVKTYYNVYKEARIRSLEKMNDHILINSTKDVRAYDVKNEKFVGVYETNIPVVTSFYQEKWLVVICTNSSIFLFNTNSGQKIAFKPHQQIDQIRSAYRTDNGIALSSNLGVHKMERVNSKWITKDFVTLKGVTGITQVNGRFYYATNKIIYSENDHHRKKLTATTYIADVKVNNRSVPFSDTLEFDYDENNVQFETGTLYYGPGDPIYKYQLIGHDILPLYSSDGIMSYSALPPGSYTFKVSASTNSVFSSGEKFIVININLPFWRQWWFIIWAVVLLIAIIITIYLNQGRKLRAKAEINETIVRLKSQALIAQLNPHLVFNILNSIQGMISESEIEKSNEYLARFAIFMRMSLQYSKEDLVSIREEIDITKKYVELELLRFPDDLVITVSSDIDDYDFKVPPLIIQPFIENAIKHGTAPLIDTRGEIHIKVSETEEGMEISILDNGIGFKKEKKTTGGDGIRISMERLKILNQENNIVVRGTPGAIKVKLIVKK